MTSEERHTLAPRFGRRLHQWLGYQGIPPEQRAAYLAERAGITSATAKRYLAGNLPGSLFEVVRVAGAIDAPLAALTGDRYDAAFYWLMKGLTGPQRDQLRRLLMRYNNGSEKAARALEMAASGQVTFAHALEIGGR